MASFPTPRRFLLLTAILLTGCAGLGGVRPAPTFDTKPIYTSAAATIRAELTASAPPPASPTIATSTPVQVGLATATMTVQLIPITPSAFLATVTPIPVSNGPVCDAALTIRDLTFPDGSTVRTGQHFFKEWYVQNVGTCTWNEGYWVVHSDGPEFRYKPHKLRKASEPTSVPPGEYAEIGIDLWAPNKPGLYTANFQLMNNWGGYPFGWLMVSVIVMY